MGKKTKVLTIKTKHQPRGRDYLGAGGRPFNTQPQHLPLSDLKKHEIEELKADPWLHVEEAEIESEEGSDGKDSRLAKILKESVAKVAAALADLNDDELVYLQTLEAEGDKRKGVIDAIEAEIEKRTKPE